MGKRAIRAGISLVAMCASFNASAVTDLPRVKATAISTTGSRVICRGEACAIVLQELQGPDYLETSSLLLRDGGAAIDHGEFCERLENARPEGCDEANPPSTPGLDPAWQPNGCGTGGAFDNMLSGLLWAAYRENYSGNIDAPYRGVDFTASCNSHDRCWGVGWDRHQCDDTFHGDMRSACSIVANSTDRNTCNGFAGAYLSAVASTPEGNENYAQAVAQRTCAVWAADMEVNACD